MTDTEIHKLLELPETERAEIAQILIESLSREPVPEWHKAILVERLAEADADPDSRIPWAEVERELWPRER